MLSATAMFVAGVGLSFAVMAGEAGVTLGDLKAKGAVKLTHEELAALLPGAKVVNFASTGSRRTWTNETSGTFAASSSNARSVGRPGSGTGTWSLAENARYCVELSWSGAAAPEKWCRSIYRVGDQFYGVSSDTNLTVAAYLTEFNK